MFGFLNQARARVSLVMQMEKYAEARTKLILDGAKKKAL